jgi:hypothetical protein
MKELHLIGFIVTYAAFFVKQRNPISLHIKELDRIPGLVAILLTLIPVLFITNNGVEHLFKIISFVFGVVSVKHLLNASSPKTKEYAHSLCLSALLVTIYNRPHLKPYIIPMYISYLIAVLLLINKKASTMENVLVESILVHLLFFFTK